jgi:hypothetical protein
MKRTFAQEEVRKMRFLEAYEGWNQGRLSQEEAANRFIQEEYRKRYNEEFQVAAQEEGSAFVPWIGGELSDILCERHERTDGWRFSADRGSWRTTRRQERR